MHNPQQDILFMQRALKLAASRRGFCAPNPSVGSVLVKDGHILAEGAHWAYGQPHAEATVLSKIEHHQARGATLYVTLEPCNHFGKTPPCTDLIQRCQLDKIFYGMADPNSRVRGGGAKMLAEAGIPCELLPVPTVAEFYQSYRYWLQSRLPWVTAKLAISLDGKVAGPNGQNVQITGEPCQRLTHQLRKHSDAILTTGVTIRADDPQLNVREEVTIGKPLYIIDRSLNISPNLRIFQTAQSITIFHGAKAGSFERQKLESLQVRCLEVDETSEGLNLISILKMIGQDGCHDLFVEAGGRCFSSFISNNLAQTAYFYIAPKLLGNTATDAFTAMTAKFSAENSSEWEIYGKDAVLKLNLLSTF